MVNTRWTLSVVSLAALIPLAALPAPASAQANAQPACVVGTLAEYLSLTGGCAIGGLAFTGFQASFGAQNVAISLSHVDVTPFSAGNQIGFSFVLNQPLSVQRDAGPGLSFAERSFEFDFTASGAGPGALIGLSPFSLFTASVAASAGGPGTGAEALTQLMVSSQATGDSVLLATAQIDGGPQGSWCAVADPIRHAATCAPLVTTAFADGAVALVGTVDAWGGSAWPASASLANLSVALIVPPTPPTVTPEPATALLLAPGIVGLGAFAARRRRKGGGVSPRDIA
jgi:hypothetical protein